MAIKLKLPVKYRLGILAVLFLATFFILHSGKFIVPNAHRIVRSFEQNIAEKEKGMAAHMDSLLSLSSSHKLIQYVRTNNVDFSEEFSEEGVAYYVYRDQELVFWSSNTMAIPDTAGWWSQRFGQVGNSWLLMQFREKENIQVIGVLQIKKSYSYENAYLRNDFHPSFGVHTGLALYGLDHEDGEIIHDAEGAPLFKICANSVGLSAYPFYNFLFLFLGVAFFLFFLQSVLEVYLKKIKYFLLSVLLLGGVYALYQIVKGPHTLQQYAIFNPDNFSSGWLYPNLGDALFVVFIVVFLVFVFYANVVLPEPKNKKRGRLLSLYVIVLIFCLAFAVAGVDLFNRLIHYSTIQFEAYDVSLLSIYSFVGYLMTTLLVAAYIFLVDKAHQYFVTYVPVRFLFWVLNLVLATGGALAFHFVDSFLFDSLIFLFVLNNYLLYLRTRLGLSIGSLVFIVLVYAVFFTLYLRKQNFQKQRESNKDLAVNMEREQDPIANALLEELIPEIIQDTLIVDRLVQPDFSYDGMVDYLRKRYFTGYLTGYDFQLTLCTPSDSLLVGDTNEIWYHCFDFFYEMLRIEGEPADVQSMYYLQKENGVKNFFLELPIVLGEGWEEVHLFIELYRKPNYEVLGYPKLLLEGPINETTGSGVTYARYRENKLVASSGNFQYAFEPGIYEKGDQAIQFFQMDGYDHILYKPLGDSVIIISWPRIDAYQILVSFTYIFIFFLFLVTVIVLAISGYVQVIDFQATVKNKVVFSILAILMFSLILMGIATAYYTVSRFNDRQFGVISEKTQSVLVELEDKIDEVSNIHEVDQAYLSHYLIKFSNVFFSDINMYDLDGILVETSRKQIFDKQLLSKRMNPNAYKELLVNKKARLVQREKIGLLSYYTTYVPFVGKNDEPIAYLSLPYFAKNEELRTELVNVVVAIINVYAFLMMLSVLIAIYISNRLTAPLRTIQERLREIQLGAENKHIEYAGTDEISELVLEYNRMLDELNRSAKLLARSERESAWREMARQIAHEIKNPLTPMKLNVQLLERSLQNDDPDFKERFEKISKNLIEQINALSGIASSFSQFARISLKNLEKINLIERIQQAVELYKNQYETNLVFKDEGITELFVQGANEPLLQVFNNLIKNAYQALDGRKDGEIIISLEQEEQKVRVVVLDNGPGIPAETKEKMFQPYFTTKSRGTGLGLAIVKTIVEDFGGEIWFESREGQGTTFFIELLRYADA